MVIIICTCILCIYGAGALAMLLSRAVLFQGALHDITGRQIHISNACHNSLGVGVGGGGGDIGPHPLNAIQRK